MSQFRRKEGSSCECDSDDHSSSHQPPIEAQYQSVTSKANINSHTFAGPCPSSCSLQGLLIHYAPLYTGIDRSAALPLQESNISFSATDSVRPLTSLFHFHSHHAEASYPRTIWCLEHAPFKRRVEAKVDGLSSAEQRVCLGSTF